MQEVEVTLTRCLKICWSWLWRSILLTWICAIPLSFIAGLIISTAALEPAQYQIATGLLVGIPMMPIGLYIYCAVLKRVIRKKSFKDFRIKLVQPDSQ
ncbi:MAG: hypothetical protein JKY15_01510 [Deltaproteobacteria bacterium]|nr:hypothetical protein [Deltaproteobacteria bacterium]